MKRWVANWAAVLLIAGFASPAFAQDFKYLGRGKLSTNDVWVDGDDRWQTGGWTYSFLAGPADTVAVPSTAFSLWELRVRTQAITPDDYEAPAAWDRPAAGVITTTLNTQFETAGFEFTAGAGLAFTGPQTHLFDVQEFIHELTPADDPFVPAGVLDAQIPNAMHFAALGEAAYRLHLDGDVTFRPFVEAQTGAETFARAGVDMFFGRGFDAGILGRDGTSGFPYQTLKGTAPKGLTLTLGADAAFVAASALLPSPAYDLTPLRLRARAGVHYEFKRASIFAGASWLGPEFTAQPTGQVVSAWQLRLKF